MNTYGDQRFSLLYITRAGVCGHTRTKYNLGQLGWTDRMSATASALLSELEDLRKVLDSRSPMRSQDPVGPGSIQSKAHNVSQVLNGMETSVSRSYHPTGFPRSPPSVAPRSHASPPRNSVPDGTAGATDAINLRLLLLGVPGVGEMYETWRNKNQSRMQFTLGENGIHPR